MNDHPAQPAPAPEVQAVATVGGVLTDLVELAEQLPVPPAPCMRTPVSVLSGDVPVPVRSSARPPKKSLLAPVSRLRMWNPNDVPEDHP